MYASNSHSYTHLILALGIVREPTVWGFITSKFPGIHDIGLPTNRQEHAMFSLKARNLGSDRKMPANRYGTGACHSILYHRNGSTERAIIRLSYSLSMHAGAAPRTSV